MVFSTRCILARLAGLVVVGALLFPGCGKSPTPPAFPWLAIRGSCPAHTVKVEINGKHYATLDKKQPPADIRRTPLREGTNDLVLTFLPRKDANTVVGSHVEVRLSPGISPPDGNMPGVECEASERLCEYRIEIERKDGLPAEIRYTRREWADDQRTKLIFQRQVTADAAEAEPKEERAWQWSEAGRPVLETHVKDGVKLLAGRFYRPDGTLGAEVKDGAGIRREWYKNGAVAKETPFLHGLIHGEEKTSYETGQVERMVPFGGDLEEGEAVMYDRRGRVMIRGRYSGGRRDGAWMRYDREDKEIGRTILRVGRRVEGTDDFGEFSAEE